MAEVAKVEEHGICKCSPVIEGTGVLTGIHNIAVSKISKYCILMDDLMFVDVGSGSGAVLYAIMHDAFGLYEGKHFNFNHIVAIDPEPSGSMYQEVELLKYKPYEMTVAEFKKSMPEKTDNYGILLSWPDPELNVDYESLALLQPKVAIIVVAYYKDIHPELKKVVSFTCAGGGELWNKVINPLGAKKVQSVKIGAHNYKLFAQSKHTEKAGRINCLQDPEEKEELARCRALPDKLQHIYRFVYVIVREDYTIPETSISALKELNDKRRKKTKRRPASGISITGPDCKETL